MRTLIFLLLFPVLLFAQGKISILRDGIQTGNHPGLVIAVFVEQPKVVLDTIGWRPVSATENEPDTRKILRGKVIEKVTDQDSILADDEYQYTCTDRFIVTEKDFQVNWALADTLLNLATTLADSSAVMKMKFIGGLFLPAGTVISKDLIDADSVWRASR